MADTVTLADMSRKVLDDQQQQVREWAATTGAQPLVTTKSFVPSAQGTLTVGGAVATAVLLELTFDTGEKRNFNGTLFGVAGGFTEGAGIYVGAIPADGDQWNMSVVGVDPVLGVVQVNFNPFLGPAGAFTCVSAGLFASSWATYGGGHWRNG